MWTIFLFFKNDAKQTWIIYLPLNRTFLFGTGIIKSSWRESRIKPPVVVLTDGNPFWISKIAKVEVIYYSRVSLAGAYLKRKKNRKYERDKVSRSRSRIDFQSCMNFRKSSWETGCFEIYRYVKSKSLPVRKLWTVRLLALI